MSIFNKRRCRYFFHYHTKYCSCDLQFTPNPFTVRQITVIVVSIAAITNTYLFHTHKVVMQQIICMHDFHNRIRQYGLSNKAGVNTIGRIFRPFVVLSIN